jgi:TRAP-type C4-dicarboxylate transport system substrate-binding protein
MRLALGLVLCLCASTAAADGPVVLRFTSVAPDGSSWARELVAFAREVDNRTAGRVHIKWYLNGVVGDEMEELKRLREGRMDGAASGGMACERLAPTLRVSHLPGVFQDRDEVADVFSNLIGAIQAEAHQQGFAVLALTPLGPSVIFTRTPVADLAALRKVKLWRWGLDEVGVAATRAMGLHIEPLPLTEAGRAFQAGRVDGFISIPSAALAFQWSSQVRYLIDLRTDYLLGCLVISERALSRLSPAEQTVVREAGARVRVRYDELGRRTDDALLGGLFQRQGLVPIAVSPSFRAEFFAAARVARERVAATYVPAELLMRVQNLLADHRAEHARSQP